MLHYAVVFFVIAIIAAVLGFGGIAAPSCAHDCPAYAVWVDPEDGSLYWAG